jgi:hypothetical protein
MMLCLAGRWNGVSPEVRLQERVHRGLSAAIAKEDLQEVTKPP